MSVLLESEKQAIAAEPPASSGIVSSKNMAYQERLDHLRFLAAFLIVFHHSVPAIMCAANGVDCNWPSMYKLTADVSGGLLAVRAFVFEGHTAVALFMTLSGFLFARICGGKTISYPRFFLNRVLRIYPIYLCAILLAMYLSPGNNGILNLATSILCLQNLPSAVAHPLLTPHLWTIAVEFQFYLLFPLLLLGFKTKGARPLLFLVGTAILLRAMVYASTGTVRDLSYQTLFGRIDQFAIGALLGFYYSGYAEKLRNPMLTIAAATAVVVGLTVFHVEGGFAASLNKSIWIVWPTLESLLWGGLIATYCAGAFTMPRWLSRAAAFLGTLSFSLYVLHYFFAHQIAKWTAPLVQIAIADQTSLLHGPAAWLVQSGFSGGLLFTLLVVVPVVTLASLVTFFAIEKPFMDLRVKYTS